MERRDRTAPRKAARPAPRRGQAWYDRVRARFAAYRATDGLGEPPDEVRAALGTAVIEPATVTIGATTPADHRPVQRPAGTRTAREPILTGQPLQNPTLGTVGRDRATATNRTIPTPGDPSLPHPDAAGAGRSEPPRTATQRHPTKRPGRSTTSRRQHRSGPRSGRRTSFFVPATTLYAVSILALVAALVALVRGTPWLAAALVAAGNLGAVSGLLATRHTGVVRPRRMAPGGTQPSSSRLPTQGTGQTPAPPTAARTHANGTLMSLPGWAVEALDATALFLVLFASLALLRGELSAFASMATGVLALQLVVVRALLQPVVECTPRRSSRSPVPSETSE